MRRRGRRASTIASMAITIDFLLAREDLPEYLPEAIAQPSMPAEFRTADVLAPIEHQEVWAAGVTYYRSRGARMEESKDAGGGDFYDRVYSAERPELFFKSTASRTVGTGAKFASARTRIGPSPSLS